MLKGLILLFVLAWTAFSNSYSQTNRKTIIPVISHEEELASYQSPVDFNKGAVNLHTSPFENIYYVKSSRTITRIQVFDHNGREVMRLDEGNELSLDDLALGEYLLKVTFTNGETSRVLQKN